MSLICSVCYRHSKISQTRSHSNIATKRRVYINIQQKVINGKKIKICAKCISDLARKNAKSRT